MLEIRDADPMRKAPWNICTAARAAAPVAALAVGPVTTQGAYYDRSTPVRSSPPSYDEAAAARLWDVTELLLTPRDPGSPPAPTPSR